MLAEELGGKRPGIPAFIHVLGDQPGPLEPGQDFVRHPAADAVMLGERALVEEEAAVSEAGGDRMLDLGINAFATVADLEVAGERGRQTEANFDKIAAEGRRAAAGDEAAAVKIADEA